MRDRTGNQCPRAEGAEGAGVRERRRGRAGRGAAGGARAGRFRADRASQVAAGSRQISQAVTQIDTAADALTAAVSRQLTATAAALVTAAQVTAQGTADVHTAAGLLDGLRATTHWAHTDVLAARFPRVAVDPDVLYVDNGSVLTSAGKAAALDLCLHLVRLDHGAAVANTVARRLVVPPHRDGGQAQFVTTPVPAPESHPLADLLPWVLERLDQPLTVEDLARQARMNSRHLGRHFRAVTGTTPLQWLLAQRIRHAQELLETTNDGMERIADATGMGTATTLRRHFHRTVGVPPDTYRRTFRS
ncbi:helix-turn-helix domain-containing protein [Kitasatospora sp. NPDC101447]|uniref:helix-turn-helix domain-containing protein n=1 Tax=Kitasatospora sp. NPDC101447 TaxID=3364102 RepID=UPI00382C946E